MRLFCIFKLCFLYSTNLRFSYLGSFFIVRDHTTTFFLLFFRKILMPFTSLFCNLSLIQWNLHIADTIVTEVSACYEDVSTLKKLSIFPLIFFKTDPLEAQISLFSSSLVVWTYQKKKTKEKRLRKTNKPSHHNINVHLFNKMLWKRKKLCLFTCS